MSYPRPMENQVRWIDLASADAGSARRFYREMFGWSDVDHELGGGTYTQLESAGTVFGSLYQIGEQALAAGVPSHWLPYVRVGNLEEACARAEALGGEIIVKPFDAGVARIAVVLHSRDAQIGLWEEKG